MFTFILKIWQWKKYENIFNYVVTEEENSLVPISLAAPYSLIYWLIDFPHTQTNSPWASEPIAETWHPKFWSILSRKWHLKDSHPLPYTNNLYIQTRTFRYTDLTCQYITLTWHSEDHDMLESGSADPEQHVSPLGYCLPTHSLIFL